ncbi:homoserine kinase type II [Streptomyces griseochromogenes]|uniref:Homoserine kinase type II n=1 Tax=Streptomyces griseochromogenes TaxID=68214 RepID=A0A1B1B466_9ACTN|nr:phosphotransferase [Streptomyces griseochromogenes]ANP53615.1 phosphotransferase [Streptomyces griseochromogenes]MBP2055429.1 homoserine kinase type II [Streptomyces griseochromogenes]
MDMNDAARGAALMADALWDRYGLAAAVIEPVHMGTDTINRWVMTEDGLRLFVKEYRSTADLDAARSAWDMAEYCRAARVPVPRVWPDVDGDLVTIAEGCAWAVTDEAPGRVNSSAMTVALAEHIGVVMGRMHRALAAYPMPQKVQQSRWRTGSVEGAAARCGSVLATALGQRHDHFDQLRLDLDQRREDLHQHVHRLREQLPDELVEQALHADLSRTNMIVLADAVTGVIDFRGARALPAWELGRAAFDPRTVANSPEWIACALAMVSAYHAENPSLPVGEAQACARIALLYMLFSFYGATTAEYGLPPAAEADLKRHWRERQTTIRLLLNHLDELEDALADLSAGGGGS